MKYRFFCAKLLFINFNFLSLSLFRSVIGWITVRLFLCCRVASITIWGQTMFEISIKSTEKKKCVSRSGIMELRGKQAHKTASSQKKQTTALDWNAAREISGQFHLSPSHCCVSISSWPTRKGYTIKRNDESIQQWRRRSLGKNNERKPSSKVNESENGWKFFLHEWMNLIINYRAPIIQKRAGISFIFTTVCENSH